MGGLSLASIMAVLLLLLLLPLAYAQFHSTLGVHPTGVSYSNRSPQGLHGHRLAVHHGFGKREAEPFYPGQGYGLVAVHHPTHHAIGYYGVHHHGYGKRSPTHRNKRPKPTRRPKRPKNSYRPRYYYYRRR